MLYKIFNNPKVFHLYFYRISISFFGCSCKSFSGKVTHKYTRDKVLFIHIHDWQYNKKYRIKQKENDLL